MKTILIIIGLFVVLRWVAKIFLRAFVFKVMNDAQRQGGFYTRTYSFGGQQNPFANAQPPMDEQVNTGKSASRKEINPDKIGGEYVDYEEVK